MMAQANRGSRFDRFDPRLAGVVVVLITLVVVFLAFTKAIPFQQHYEIKAVVRTSSSLVPGSPVRIAGVNVGKVTAIGRYEHTRLAELTMRIDGKGQPIRRDAELKIRPRLLLEGSFYVDLQPGTPDAPQMPNGGLIPLASTTVAVQLDQAVSPLRADVRRQLTEVVRGLGDAVGTRPTRAADATQDPGVRGLTGGEALGRTLDSAPEALRDAAIVGGALRGEQPGDLPRLLHGFSRTIAAVAGQEARLTGLVRDLDTTFGVTAIRSVALRDTVREAAGVAARGGASLASLRDALPGTRQLARELGVGLDGLPATIEAAGPWLGQALPLLGDRELGGLARSLAPASSGIAALTGETGRLLPRVEALATCTTGLLIPTAEVKLDDGPLSTGVENYKELLYAMVGQASEGQSFDGNGSFLRLQAIGSDRTIHSGQTNYSGRSMVSSSAVRPQRTAPAFTAEPPPLRRDVPCSRNRVPDLNGPASRGPADGARPDGPAPAPPTLSSTPPKGFRP